MTKTQEQYQAEYDALEAQERSLELRLEEEHDELNSLQFDKKDTADIHAQIDQTNKELRKVQRDMLAVSEEAGWEDEEEDDELFYAEQAGWVEPRGE